MSLWVATPCGLTRGYRRFGATCRLLIQSVDGVSTFLYLVCNHSQELQASSQHYYRIFLFQNFCFVIIQTEPRLFHQRCGNTIN
jgi:hypothetical protein